MDITLCDDVIVNEISDEQAILQELADAGPAALAAYVRYSATHA